ncbi:MAG TPA: acetyl-CoA carboxylase, carboxyltransferase subunit beta [Clostridiaceae bacterium]
MLNGLFKKTKYITVAPNKINTEEIEVQKPNIPNGMWVKCHSCGQILYWKDLEENHLTCQYCKVHFRVNSRDRIASIVDEDSFIELDEKLSSKNPLAFPGYDEKVKGLQEETGLIEAVVCGIAKIDDIDIVIAVMDSRFIMASMGSAVGEKITRAVEMATEKRVPIIIFTASSGARMQEGMYSLMQMAKTSAALGRHNQEGLLYIAVLTDPTTGGVTASFAMLGDIILAEPGTLIGFAGKRVIEQTIKQKLPDGFQRAEFLLKHGFIDAIIERKDLKATLGEILKLHRGVN